MSEQIVTNRTALESSNAAPLSADDGEVMEGVVATTRAVLEALLSVEYHLAALSTVAERFGTRYQPHANAELAGSMAALSAAEQRRRAALAYAGTKRLTSLPSCIDDLIEMTEEPYRSQLVAQRGELRLAQRRITVLRARAEDFLGRRIALVAEAMTHPRAEVASLYGREVRPRPRLVRATL